MKLPPVVYALISATFFLFLYAMGVTFPQMVNSTKITDWAMAVFNGIIAVMAIIAYFVAKDWKLSLTAKEAVLEGVRLKKIGRSKLLKSMHLFHSCSHLHSTFRHNVRDGYFNDKNTKRFFLNFSNIYKELQTYTEHTSLMHESIGVISTFGWQLSKSKALSLIELDKCVDDIYHALYNLEEYLNESLSSSELHLDVTHDFPRILYADINADVDSVIEAMNLIASDGNKCTNLIGKFAVIQDLRQRCVFYLNSVFDPYENIHNLIHPINDKK